jgi:tRNA uridine 5-carbamoylmethylation protein Kti12
MAWIELHIICLAKKHIVIILLEASLRYPNMITLCVVCGVPGSGKTTLSKKIESGAGFFRISYDELRCGSPRQLIKPIVDTLIAGDNVVVDYINNWRATRLRILNATQNINCEKIIIVIQTPLEECIRRNSTREYPTPSVAIKALYNSFQFPTLDEGWDDIITIDNNTDLSNVLNLLGGGKNV